MSRRHRRHRPHRRRGQPARGRYGGALATDGQARRCGDRRRRPCNCRYGARRLGCRTRRLGHRTRDFQRRYGSSGRRTGRFRRGAFRHRCRVRFGRGVDGRQLWRANAVDDQPDTGCRADRRCSCETPATSSTTRVVLIRMPADADLPHDVGVAIRSAASDRRASRAARVPGRSTNTRDGSAIRSSWNGTSPSSSIVMRTASGSTVRRMSLIVASGSRGAGAVAERSAAERRRPGTALADGPALVEATTFSSGDRRASSTRGWRAAPAHPAPAGCPG